MERTTIMLPHDLKAKAIKKAREMGMSLGQFIRKSVESNLDKQKEEDTFFSDDAVYFGESPSDLSERLDDYLYGNES